MIQVSIYSGDVLTNQATFESQELADAWIAYHNFGDRAVVEDITAKLEQEAANKAALEFLANTDYKVLRHLRQQALGIATSLTAEEYLELEHERQMAAESIK